MKREVGEEFVGDSGDRVNPLTDLGRKVERQDTCTLFPSSSFWLEQNSLYCLSCLSIPFHCYCYLILKLLSKSCKCGFKKSSTMERHHGKPPSLTPLLSICQSYTFFELIVLSFLARLQILCKKCLLIPTMFFILGVE